ncbi:MAG: LamG domain-containing protein [Verrucomicrobia bacterium]|nr:LamG domain-containing protein [Verrucomicrobiota bacterium]
MNAQLKDGLIAYWPLDEVQGTKTPELINGYDMQLTNLSADDVVEGKIGNAFSFSNEKQTLLSRVHAAADQLPANKYDSFSISMWSKVDGNGQNDLRLFSEGNTGNSNPLFNIGTDSGGASGSIDFYIRQSGWPTVNHIKSYAEPYDGEWHHVVFVQEEGERRVYVDGELDDVELVAKPDGTFNVNDTTIGGILRSSASHWVTGLIDDVAVWKRALDDDEAAQVHAEGLASLFPTLGNGLIAHWPLDEVQGTKTPELINGYDMELTNLSADDVVEGKIGNAFSFSNEKQTLLSRVHAAADLLPANKYDSFSVSMWSKVDGNGQNDLRLFSEGNTGNSNPLFNIGTANNGASGSIDFYIRQSGWPTVNHIHSTAEPYDGEWHHVVFVQEEGERRVYVDGELDDVSMEAKPDGTFNVNDTTIGGILRSSASHWVTGLIDDVAIWKRSLSDDEVGALFTSGIPTGLQKKLPLEIRTFGAEFPSVAAGGKVTLNWDVSADATLYIEPKALLHPKYRQDGIVNPVSEFGVGFIDVTVKETTTFTLKAVRGDETLESAVTVEVVSGVGDGWALLDNFETRALGSINGQGGWQNPEGSAIVVEADGNKALGFDGQNDLNALQLRSLKIPVGNKATVFLRLATIEDDASDGQVNTLFGLTEKPIRFVGDFNNDAGPLVRLTKPDGFNPIVLNSRNGVGNEYSIGDSVFDFGGVYNIWIDVENKSNEDGDVYSVYIAEEGQAERVVVFENFVSDRNPAGTVDLGKPKADLLSLLVMSSALNAGVGNLLFDDLYISIGKHLDTVPVASAFAGAAVPEIVLHSSRVSDGGAGFSFDWNSTAGNIYQVQRQATLTAPWQTIADAYPEGGATADNTSYTDTGLGASAIYRVAQLAKPPLFFDDFESGAKGWEASDLGESGTLWELGKPTNGPGEAHSPVNVYGTGLAEDYDDYTDVYLASPVIDLTDVDNARLEFWSYRDCEPPLDGELMDWCQIMILDEEGDYLVEDPIWIRGGEAKQWRLEKAKIPAEALGQKIRLEFNFSTDGGQDNGPQAGWFIDDVAITTK